MGERLLCKQEVIGSIPFTSTIHCQWQVWSEVRASAAAARISSPEGHLTAGGGC